MDLAEAIREDLGEDIGAYSNKELCNELEKRADLRVVTSSVGKKYDVMKIRMTSRDTASGIDFNEETLYG